MNCKLYVAEVRFIIDTYQNEEEVKQQLEYAINTACSQLEQELNRHESISYRMIEELREIG
jgi:hypothetical protein